MKQTTVHASIIPLLWALLFVITATSAQAALPAPSSIDPVAIGSTEAEMSALRVSWSAVAGATQYRLQISNSNGTNANGTFTCTLGTSTEAGAVNCNEESPAVGHPTTNGWLTDTHADTYNLTCNTTYYVHVKATSDTEESPWSPTYSFTTTSCPNLSAVAIDKPGWELTFQDEFEGRVLDTNKWNKQNRHNATLHNELQAYMPDNMEVQNGILRIRADERDGEYGFTTLDYTSGIIVSASKFDQQYGYFEMRARMPVGRGVWPAFWLRPDDLPQGSDEIDIFEFYGRDQPNVMHFTYHPPSGQMDHLAYTAPFDFTAGYHRFAVEWGPGYIYWYLDPDSDPTPDEAVHSATQNITAKTMYVLANLALAGFSGGTFDSTTVFPNYYDIDYIRVYRKDDGTINVPTIGPTKDARVFNESALVTLETSTLGSTIYYTLDGSDPTIDSTAYSAPFNLFSTTTVKTFATASGHTDSPITIADFTIIPNTESLPSAWQEANIGNTFTSVPTRYSNGTYVVAGDGATIGNFYDNFKFVYQQLIGDGEIIARVVALDPTHPEAKAGLMMRQSLEKNSPFAGVQILSRQGMEYLTRFVPGDYNDVNTKASGRVYPGFSAPWWLKVVKVGNDYSYYSGVEDPVSGNVDWGKLSTQTVDLGSGPVYVGLAVTSRFNANEAKAVFDSITMAGEFLTPTTCLGDVNQDTNRDLSDAIRCIRYLVGLDTLTGAELTAADSNQDGSVDLSDVIRLIRDLLGLEPLPVCQ